MYNKNHYAFNYPTSYFRNDKNYFLPPRPYEDWEKKGTYVKIIPVDINGNYQENEAEIYADGSPKTYYSYEFVVNKRGGEKGSLYFNNPVDYIKINDRVEYYLNGKLKFIGYVEFVSNASKDISIIPAWGKLEHQYFAGSSIEESIKTYKQIVFDMKDKIIEAGIKWNDDLITVSDTYRLETAYSGKNVVEILEELEDVLSANWCFGVNLNNEFFFYEVVDKPFKRINFFENHFSESEYELDSSNLITRYVCKVKTANSDTSGTRTLPIIVGSGGDYPPIALEKEIGIKVDIFEETTGYLDTPEGWKEVYNRAYTILNNQIKSEIITLKNINHQKIDIDFNDCIKIIMKPSNNYYNETPFEEPIYNAYTNNNLYGSEVLAIDRSIDLELIPNNKQASDFSLYDIDLNYKELCLTSYNIKKIYIYFSIDRSREVSGIFTITDGVKSIRKYCVNGFGEFDCLGFDKQKIRIINEKSNVVYDRITAFFDIGVREYVMNARNISYKYENGSLEMEGKFAKMNVKMTNYLHQLNYNINRVSNIINN